MRESYVEYILGECKSDRISHYCTAYATSDDLIQAAKSEFCGKRYILGQGNIIYALQNYLDEQRETVFSQDAKKLYNRCVSRTDDMFSLNRDRKNVNYDELFELLVDVNWLVASIWTVQKKQRVNVPLESNIDVIYTRLRNALENDFRQQAYWHEEQCGYIEEAGKLKNQVFPGLCFSPEVQQYIPMSADERDKVLRQAKDNSVYALALYYALTATLVKSEEIRRMR